MEEILDIQANMNIPWQISSVCNCLGKVLCVNTHTQPDSTDAHIF